MSAIAEDIPQSIEGASLKQRAARRRAELLEQSTFKLPVAGYEDMFVAEYRGLSYTEIAAIRKRNNANTTDGELATFADDLINACINVYEVTPDGEIDPELNIGLRSLDGRWTTSFIRENFDVDLPADATARTALNAVLPDNYLAAHHLQWDLTVGADLQKHDKEIAGNSGASSAGT